MVCTSGCGKTVRDPSAVTFLVESNPANLDPRFAADAASQRIVGLIFSGLVERDEQMNLRGDLAESWENPDPLTYVFHLRPGAKFHDGRAVTAKDVKATFDFMMKAENRSPKRGAFRMVAAVEAPDAETVIFRLKEPYASFVWNLARPAVGIVPADAGADFGRKLIGSGPFRFISQAQDDYVVVERFGDYFGGKEETARERSGHRDLGGAGTLPRSLRSEPPKQEARLSGRDDSVGGAQEGGIKPPQQRLPQEKSPPIATLRKKRSGQESAQSGAPGETVTPGAQSRVSMVPEVNRVELVTFRVVPDAIVRALELKKGSGDVEMSSLSADMIPVLAKQKDLMVSERAGTNLAYVGINMEDSILAHKEVRQALAYATDRESLIKYLLHGQARLASGVLPPNHWAFEGDVRKYGFDLAEAEKLLDAAGFPRKSDGMRLKLTLKVSTDEQARLIGAALQEQWKRAGVELEVRPLEIATLFADLGKGNFQLSYLKWVGANNDPDMFEFVFSSRRFPPDGANRGHYRNARMDVLTDEIRGEMDREKRKVLCSEAQKLAAEDVPYIVLWYTDVVSVHRRELGEIRLTAGGDYDFLMGE